jgi:hypothetical protein
MRVEVEAQISESPIGANVVFVALDHTDGVLYDNAPQDGHIVIRNTTGATIVATLSTDRKYSPQQADIVPKSYSIPANADAFVIPPLQNSNWSQADTSTIYLDAASEGLWIAIVRLQ